MFIDLMVKMMSEDKYKAKITYLLNNGIYPFIYDVREIATKQFLNLEIFGFDNF